jgi:hypothetical protein
VIEGSLGQEVPTLHRSASSNPDSFRRHMAEKNQSIVWFLERALKLVIQMTLMTIGLYNEPSGAWLPSTSCENRTIVGSAGALLQQAR